MPLQADYLCFVTNCVGGSVKVFFIFLLFGGNRTCTDIYNRSCKHVENQSQIFYIIPLKNVLQLLKKKEEEICQSFVIQNFFLL